MTLLLSIQVVMLTALGVLYWRIQDSIQLQLLTTLASFPVPELVLSVMRAMGMQQTQLVLKESAKKMEHGLEVPSFVVRMLCISDLLHTIVIHLVDLS